MNPVLKKIVLTVWLTAISSGIAFLFWHNEWKFNLPTPVPAGYQPVLNGSRISLRELTGIDTGKIVFLHFFNPDCPCSRFNLSHFKSLVKKYGNRVSFAVIVYNKNNALTAEATRDRFNLPVPVFINHGLAAACGVYATPQAAIITRDHKLWYRGNYNISRYCTAVATNFAQLALDSLLQDHALPQLGNAAYQSYGCQLPYCKK